MAFGLIAVSCGPGSAVAAGAMPLVPHRAVYDIKLAETVGGIEDVTGRLVFELSGSGCEGYVMNTRFVLNTVLSSRSILNDFQSSTWEDPDENAFRFISKDYVDNELSKEANGMATATKDRIAVSMTAPEEKTVELDGPARFPVQHLQNLIAAARDQERVFQSQLYDGTEGGEKIYATTAIIGEPMAEPDEATPVDELVGGMRLWPVVMSYFDDAAENANDGLPIYEMSFELYENGVTRSLLLDYGDFKLDGELSVIELFEPTDCG